MIDRNLTPVVANPAFYDLLNVGPGELQAHSLEEFFLLERPEGSLRAELARVFTHGVCLVELEVHCKVALPAPKILCMNARRLGGDDSRLDAILIEVRDITRKKTAEQQVQELNLVLRMRGKELEEMNQELESFTHSAAHDLRMPLRLTNKVAHLLLREHEQSLPGKAIEKVHMILDSTREMGTLIEDLLKFSHLSREPMKLRQVDLEKLAGEALDELHDELQSRGVEVVLGALPCCPGDRALLKQVFLNLLGNALKFTRATAGPRIEMGYERGGGEGIYYIRDNGVGFDSSQLPLLFRPFQRLHKAHFEGTGVGLALVKRIVERHGGRIWAEGHVDQGATFFFTLAGEADAAEG